MELELQLMRGLPKLQVLGLPDQMIKESFMRIKSALMSTGFSWPNSQQILVNLRPADVKKHSLGLEFAIAVALLLETQQIKLELPKDRLFIYGELGLDGRVLPPKDLECLRPLLHEDDVVLTSFEGDLSHKGRVYLKTLADLKEALVTFREDEIPTPQPERPQLPDLWFSKDQAHVLALSAVSGASTLLAGPPGSGKTTFAESLFHLLPDLAEEDFLNLRAHHLQFGEDLKFRPMISPHHSTPIMSLIGGGGNLFPGEVAKAHGGLLILDEFLLFPARVIDALREPLASQKIQVARGGAGVTWPAAFQFVATTNLCPCGKLSAKRNFSCGYTLQKCRSTWERLSGPMLDRFDLVVLTDAYRSRGAKEELVSLAEVKKQVDQARRHLSESASLKNACSQGIPEVYRVFQSRRRENALVKLARAQAALEGRAEISSSNWTDAFLLSQRDVKAIGDLFAN